MADDDAPVPSPRPAVQIPGSKEVRLRVANGALLDIPVHEKSKRGKNWMAVIDIDPTMPGGLARRWINRGRGDCYYVIDQLALFDAVEIAADFTNYNGSKTFPTRWFGVVVARTDDYIIVEEFKRGVDAVLAAKEKRVSAEARVRALREEQATLQARADSIQGEIEGVEAARAVDAPTPEA